MISILALSLPLVMGGSSVVAEGSAATRSEDAGGQRASTPFDAGRRRPSDRPVGVVANPASVPTITSKQHPGSGNMGTPTNNNVPPGAGPGPLVPLFYTIHIGGFINGTQTGYWEEFMVAPADQSKPRPLLVIFHKFGVSQADGIVNTEFFQEARRREWNVVCHLGASGVHFSSMEGQKNTETALQWVFDNFNIEMTRIYGVGFSMGGNSALNYAARHLDPLDHMFASVVNHTGGVSHNDTYPRSPNSQFIFDFWFGDGTPGSADPWEMSRSSMFDFDPLTLAIDPDTDLARNLNHVPVKMFRASNEPLKTAYLTTQHDLLHSHFAGLGMNLAYEIKNYSGHSWEMLDEREVCAFLGAQRLRVPANADTLADHDGIYFYFEVVQDTPNQFTPFSWSFNPTQNKVLLWKSENLAGVKVDYLAAGLTDTQTIRVVLATNDGLSDQVSLKSWPAPPSEVRRDDIVMDQNWTYNATTQTLIIQEWDGTATHIWDIDP